MSPLIEAVDLRLRRGGREVLRGVSLTLRAGEVLVVLGPNGAGKTTLLECIAGLLRADAGEVRLRGRRLSGLRDHARVFSFLLDEAELPEEVTVRTLLAHARTWGGASDPALGDSLRASLDLISLLGARGRELSRGERRRVALFHALCTERPVLVLDEPLGVFDPRQLKGVLRLLRERAAAGAALLLSVHQMSDAEKIADRCLLLHDGRVLASGTLDELRTLAASPGAPLEDVFLALLARDGGADAAA